YQPAGSKGFGDLSRAVRRIIVDQKNFASGGCQITEAALYVQALVAKTKYRQDTRHSRHSRGDIRLSRSIKAYWWSKVANVGDALTPLLLEHFGFEPIRFEPQEADVCVIGSIVEVIGPAFTGAVIGAGFIADGAAMTMPNARLLALRGPLTAARLG